MMNYHELTMHEARDSPARRQQFLVICTIMTGCFLYATVTAGVFTTVTSHVGTMSMLQGSSNSDAEAAEFCFKMTRRDYAASPSLCESMGSDIGLRPRDFADHMYCVYLDDPAVITVGRQQRFACGLLAHKYNSHSNYEKTTIAVEETKEETKTTNKKKKKKRVPTVATADINVSELNERLRQAQAERDSLLRKPKNIDDEEEDEGAMELWLKLPVQCISIPMTTQQAPPPKALIAHFPFSNGFVSSLVLSWKIIPTLRKQAAAVTMANVNPAKLTVISTCSIADSMCTHMVPLEEPYVTAFLLGQVGMSDYQQELQLQRINSNAVIDFDEILVKLRKYIPFLAWILPEPSTTTSSTTTTMTESTPTTTTTTAADSASPTEHGVTTTTTTTQKMEEQQEQQPPVSDDNNNNKDESTTLPLLTKEQQQQQQQHEQEQTQQPQEETQQEETGEPPITEPHQSRQEEEEEEQAPPPPSAQEQQQQQEHDSESEPTDGGGDEL